MNRSVRQFSIYTRVKQRATNPKNVDKIVKRFSYGPRNWQWKLNTKDKHCKWFKEKFHVVYLQEKKWTWSHFNYYSLPVSYAENFNLKVNETINVSITFNMNPLASEIQPSERYAIDEKRRKNRHCRKTPHLPWVNTSRSVNILLFNWQSILVPIINLFK